MGGCSPQWGAALALSTAEGEGIVEAGKVADMVNGDCFEDVCGVGIQDDGGSTVDGGSSDGDDALRRQLLSELKKGSVLEEVAYNGYLGGVVSMECERDVMTGECFGFEEGFSLFFGLLFGQGCVLAAGGSAVDVSGVCDVLYFCSYFEGRLPGYV